MLTTNACGLKMRQRSQRLYCTFPAYIHIRHCASSSSSSSSSSFSTPSSRYTMPFNEEDEAAWEELGVGRQMSPLPGRHNSTDRPLSAAGIDPVHQVGVGHSESVTVCSPTTTEHNSTLRTMDPSSMSFNDFFQHYVLPVIPHQYPLPCSVLGGYLDAVMHGYKDNMDLVLNGGSGKMHAQERHQERSRSEYEERPQFQLHNKFRHRFGSLMRYLQSYADVELVEVTPNAWFVTRVSASAESLSAPTPIAELHPSLYFDAVLPVLNKSRDLNNDRGAECVGMVGWRSLGLQLTSGALDNVWPPPPGSAGAVALKTHLPIHFHPAAAPPPWLLLGLILRFTALPRQYQQQKQMQQDGAPSPSSSRCSDATSPPLVSRVVTTRREVVRLKEWIGRDVALIQQPTGKEQTQRAPPAKSSRFTKRTPMKPDADENCGGNHPTQATTMVPQPTSMGAHHNLEKEIKQLTEALEKERRRSYYLQRSYHIMVAREDRLLRSISSGRRPHMLKKGERRLHPFPRVSGQRWQRCR